MVKKFLCVLSLVVALCFATSGMVFAAPLNLENDEYVRTFASELVVGGGLNLYNNNDGNGELDFEFEFTYGSTLAQGQWFTLTSQLDPAGTAVWRDMDDLDVTDFAFNGANPAVVNLVDDGSSSGTFVIDLWTATSTAVIQLGAGTNRFATAFDAANDDGVVLTAQTSVALKVNLARRADGKSIYANGTDNYLAFNSAIETTIAPNINVDNIDVGQQRLFFIAAGGAPGDNVVNLGTVDYDLVDSYNSNAGDRAPYNQVCNPVTVGDVLSKVGATLTGSDGTYAAFQPVTGGLSLQDAGCAAADAATNPATFLSSTIAQWTASAGIRNLVEGTANVCGMVDAANTIPIEPIDNSITLNPQANAGFSLGGASQTGPLASLETNGDNAMLWFANSPNAAPGFFARVTNAGTEDATVYVDVWEEDGTPAPNFSFDLYTVSGATTSPSFNASGELNAQASFLFSAQALMDAAPSPPPGA
jgi:hypothetical protein